jgi:hypothetical protein
MESQPIVWLLLESIHERVFVRSSSLSGLVALHRLTSRPIAAGPSFRPSLPGPAQGAPDMVDDFIVRAIFEEELGLRYKSSSEDDHVPAVQAPPETAALERGLLRRLLAEAGTFNGTKL